MSSSAESTRPEHLYRRERPLVAEALLGPSRLFRRCLRENFAQDGVIASSALRLPDLSVLREDLGARPEDARWVCSEHVAEGQPVHYPETCIIVLPASAIPPEQQADNGGKTYAVRVEHDPCEDLYPHAEVRIFDGQTRITEQNAVPSSVKKRLRQKITDSVTAIFLP